jgi:hypothetical protein
MSGIPTNSGSHLFAYAEELVLGGALRRALAAGALCARCSRAVSLPGMPMHLSFFSLCFSCFDITRPFCQDIVVDLDVIIEQSRGPGGASSLFAGEKPFVRCYSNFALVVQELKKILLHPFEGTKARLELIRSRNYLEPSTMCMFIGTSAEIEEHLRSCTCARATQGL